MTKKGQYMGANIGVYFSGNFRNFLQAVYSELSQKKIAESLDISIAQFNKYISGHHYPSFENMDKMLTLGVSIDWLLTGNGSAFATNDFGKKTKEKFLNFLHSKNHIDEEEDTITNIELLKEINTRFGNEEGFFRFLEENGISYDRNDFTDFFAGNQMVEFAVEKVFSQFIFLFFVRFRSHQDLDSFRVIYNNILENDEDVDKSLKLKYQQSKVNDLLNNISSLIQKYRDE